MFGECPRQLRQGVGFGGITASAAGTTRPPKLRLTRRSLRLEQQGSHLASRTTTTKFAQVRTQCGGVRQIRERTDGRRRVGRRRSGELSAVRVNRAPRSAGHTMR